MKSALIRLKIFLVPALLFLQFGAFSQAVQYQPIDKVRADFKALLDRPRAPVNPTIETIKTDSVIIEKGWIYTEKTEKVPLLIYKPITGNLSYPVVIFLHGTSGTKDSKEVTDVLYKLTKLGIMGVAIDARYHGERVADGAHGSSAYADAAYRAWKNTDKVKQEHPFLYDTSYDLWRLVDYLVSRADVEATRIGMSGISMGGIETWMAAAVDTRIKVVVPNIAVQSFKWSLDNNQWQGRVNTIKSAHQREAKDLGDAEVNAANVKQMWNKILPGITGEFDCPSMLRLIAPRPMLILSNEKDQNCPLPGALIAFQSAAATYKSLNAADKLKMDVAPNQPHRSTPEHIQLTLDWFAKWL